MEIPMEQKLTSFNTKHMQLFVINWMDIKHPNAGGAEVHLHEIAKRLVRSGHDITLLCTRYQGSSDQEIIDGVRVFRRGYRYNFNLAVLMFILTEQSKWKKSTLIIEDISKVPFAVLPFLGKRSKIVITHHLFKGVFTKEISLPLIPIVWIGERLLVLYRRIPFIAQSIGAKVDLISIGIPKPDIRIIYTGLDHKVYVPNPKERSREPLVVYVGMIKEYKCLHHLIKAMAIVRENQPTAKLVIAGKGDSSLYQSLGRLSRSLGLDEAITFVGSVSTDEKVKLMQHAHVLVNLSAKEGWGLPVIEANACGTPAIAYDVPSLNESIRKDETGLLVPYGDICLLAKAIIKVLKDEKLRQNLSQNAMKWAANFSWDKTAMEFEKIFQKVVDK